MLGKGVWGDLAYVQPGSDRPTTAYGRGGLTDRRESGESCVGRGKGGIPIDMWSGLARKPGKGARGGSAQT